VRSLRIMKALRANVVAVAAFLGLVLLGSTIGGYILVNQRLYFPGWVPVIGESHFMLRAELKTGQGILPGQGQAVNVSGVRVGDIAAVELVDGNAVATLRIEERFGRVYPDATLLLRPKTSVKDMVAELDPGSPASGARLESGALLEIDATQPDVNFSDFLETLDADTRDYLKLLVHGGRGALRDGGGRDLANAFRRFQPLARDSARASRLVALRRERLERVMSNFSKLMHELGRHDDELARFVGGSAAVFRRFANQNENLAETIELLPGALDSTNRAFERLDRLGQTMETSFTALRPMASGLAPTLRQLRPFFRDTIPPIRDQLRPFAVEAQPIARELRKPAHDLAATMPELQRFFEVFNAIWDELAYDPPGNGKGDQSYLFYGPWAIHNTNSTLAAQDGIGPVRRGVVLIPCGSLGFLESIASGERNPLLNTLIKLLNAPDAEQLEALGCRG
jgi:phospholipid/cholesterol/gamma-HCH transport system substrate-binding protein